MRSTTAATVTVLVLRHGEREDEALKNDPDDSAYQRYKRTRTVQDRFDPNLTANGYIQAKRAFDRVLYDGGFATSGEKRRVALFTSPLRRTIGTSLMISAAGTSDRGLDESFQRMVEWGFTDRETTTTASLSLKTTTTARCTKTDDSEKQQDQQQKQQQEDERHQQHSDMEVVPITVMNGLGDCASAVVPLGGAHRAVEQGMIACASVSANDARGGSDGSTPIMKEIAKMQERAAKGIDSMKGTTTTTAASSAANQEFPRRKRMVRFLQGNVGSGNPMSSPISYRPAMVAPPTSLGGGDSPRTEDEGDALPTREQCMDARHLEHFDEAMDRCVRLSINDRCDTMIVVCHREGIRDLAERCLLGKPPTERNLPRFRTPYCCVGTFTAAIEVDDVNSNSNNDNEVRWQFERVTAFEDFFLPKPPTDTCE